MFAFRPRPIAHRRFALHSARAVVAALVVASVLAFMPAAPASAELAPEPDNSWGVVGLEGYSGPDMPRSEVWAIEQIGNTMYVGGRFLAAQQVGGNPTIQPFLAAFHADTGKWIDWWRPSLDDAVWSLEASADGKRLFVGGRFTQVNGVERRGFVALHPSTGQIDTSFPVNIAGPGTNVRVVHLGADGWLYIAGTFDRVRRFSGVHWRQGLARVRPTNGRVSGWAPTVQGQSVWGLDVDPGRNRVYLTGLFSSVNNAADTAKFAIVNHNNGQVAPVNNPFPMLAPDGIHQTKNQHDVLAVGPLVWVAGSEHTIYIFNASDMSLHGWHYTGLAGSGAGGDFQDLERAGNRIYASCHCGVDIKSSYTGGMNGLVRPVRFAAAFSATTGRYDSNYSAQFTGSAGPWAIKAHSTDGCVWFGGDMTTAGGQPVESLVRQCNNGTPGPAAGPQLTNTAAAAKAVSSCKVTRNGTKLRVTWKRANNDNASKFVVRRSKDFGNYFWAAARKPPATAWADLNVAPGKYRYTVQVVAANGSKALRHCNVGGPIIVP
jgi:hypothetical protein